MRAINKNATEVMDRLTGGLNIENTAKKIDNARRIYKPVHVNWINTVPDGELCAVGHYRKWNGDLMCNPSITFLKVMLGRYYPIHYRFGGSDFVNRGVVFDENNDIMGFYPKEQRDKAAIFAGQWIMEIKDQQGIK